MASAEKLLQLVMPVSACVANVVCQPFWHRLRRLPRGASANLTRGFTKHLALASYRVLSALIVVLLKGGDQTAMSVDDDAGSAIATEVNCNRSSAGDLYVWVGVVNDDPGPLGRHRLSTGRAQIWLIARRTRSWPVITRFSFHFVLLKAVEHNAMTSMMVLAGSHICPTSDCPTLVTFSAYSF